MITAELLERCAAEQARLRSKKIAISDPATFRLTGFEAAHALEPSAPREQNVRSLLDCRIQQRKR